MEVAERERLEERKSEVNDIGSSNFFFFLVTKEPRKLGYESTWVLFPISVIN